jgi:hypothetical protein
VITPRTSARIITALRQPTLLNSQASIGMKIVLASPATSVTVRSARSRRRVNQDTMAAKAGS